MKKISFQKLKKLLPGLQKKVPLKNYTTFKVGGAAQYFFIARKKGDLIEAVMTARKFKLPYFILGGGSNILVSDKGYQGLVIKYQKSKMTLQDRDSKCQKEENI